MSPNQALMKLRELHDELVGLNDNLKPSERVDEQTIDALGQLVTDLGDLVENLKESGAPDEYREQRDDLAKRIETFEARHPRVTQFLSQVTDLLAMMGI